MPSLEALTQHGKVYLALCLPSACLCALCGSPLLYYEEISTQRARRGAEEKEENGDERRKREERRKVAD
jgi:hypothetical protein